ncbi:alpha/beta-hydrolase [Metschnikowia bicuspidata]|uniref:Alpha/beta-hydrolase n=1 Tax=Metschnikowia bicuspidata TaxID=27322 RepID=A0A4P9ZKD6_9ASCO|nr:alpha/beta-hydrolase [Metschnikowia bicuspidata]
MTTLQPEPKGKFHSTFVRYFLIFSSSINSFLFIFVLVCCAVYHHILDNITGREKNNRPKKNNDTEKYLVREPYPNIGKVKVTDNLRYYAQLLDLDLEEYPITTKDKYVLTLHRLIQPKESAEERNQRTPILLQHGLLLCSGAWLTPGRNSLAYYFVEKGFDVWMGNNRCGFEPKHTEYSGNLFHNEQFWDWDVRWLAYYDLPCIIDNVLSKKPMHDKLFLVGHLQGCTQLLILLRNGEFADIHKKIEYFFALAPAAFPGIMFYERSFIKFMHNRSLKDFRFIFGCCCFLKILGFTRKIIGTTWMFRSLSYVMFKYLFGWSIKNSYNHNKVIHLQFFFNISNISSRLMSWWLSEPVKEGFLNQLQPQAAYLDGTNAVFTPAASLLEKQEAGSNEPEIPLHADDSQTFFPYKEEWFTSTLSKNLIPIMAFIGGEDFLVDGKRFITHMRHYERHFYKEGNNLELVEVPDYNHLDVIWALNCIRNVGMPIEARIETVMRNRAAVVE